MFWACWLEKGNSTNSVFTASDHHQLNRNAAAVKCVRPSTFQHRCNPDVFITAITTVGGGGRTLNQTWTLPLDKSNLSVSKQSGWTTGVAGAWCEWITGLKTWIIDAVYECMFSSWPLGLQWKLPLKRLEEKLQSESETDEARPTRRWVIYYLGTHHQPSVTCSIRAYVVIHTSC